MALTTQDEGNAGLVERLARAELDRVARDLARKEEPVPAEAAPGASLAELVAARDAQLWAAIDAGGFADE